MAYEVVDICKGFRRITVRSKTMRGRFGGMPGVQVVDRRVIFPATLLPTVLAVLQKKRRPVKKLRESVRTAQMELPL